MKKTIELTLSFLKEHQAQADLVKGLLSALGYPWERIVERYQSGRIDIVLYFATMKQAEGIKGQLSALALKGFVVRCNSLVPEDWESKWKDDFHSFDIGRRFRVVPIWEKEKFQSKDRVPIYIDTGMAFGTGLHETTRFMIEFIERCRGKFKSFMDLGTGTGILAIAAYHCGARDIQAIDINADAVVTARNNLRLNSVRFVKVARGDLHSMSLKKTCDFVAVNILTHDLIQAKREIFGMVNKGGYLALSGVSCEHYQNLRQAYAEFPLKCVKIQKGKDWTACLFRKEL